MKTAENRKDARVEFAQKHGLNAIDKATGKPIECDAIHIFGEDGRELKDKMIVRDKK